MSTKKEDVVEETINSLQQELKEVTKKIANLSQESENIISEQAQKLSKHVEEHPLPMLALAAGCGFLLGLLIKK